MNAKDKKKWFFVGILCFTMCLLCGCKGNQPMEIDTTLELNSAFKGKREMSTVISESVFNRAFNGDLAQLQSLVTEKCPATMLCTADETEEGIKITMTLEFANYKDYTNKIGLILGEAPGVYYDSSDSIFKNGFMIKENFSSLDLFGWLVDALKEKYSTFSSKEITDMFESGTTMVHYAGRTFETSDQIQVEDMDSKAFNRISAEVTMNEDGSYKAELNFIVDLDIYYSMGDEMDQAIKDLLPDGGIFGVTNVDEERVYSIAFSALNENGLVSQLNRVLQSKDCKFSVEAEGDESDPFKAHKEIVIYLDGSYFLDFTEEETELIYKLNVDSDYGFDSCESVAGFLKDYSSDNEGQYTTIYMTVSPSDEVHVSLSYAIEMQKLEVETKIINDASYERNFQFVFSTAQAKLVGDNFEKRLNGRMDEDMSLNITESQGYKSYTVSFSGNSLEEISKKTTQFLDGSLNEDASTFSSVITGGKTDKKTLKTKSYVYEDIIDFEIFLGGASLKEGIIYSIEYPRGYAAKLEEGSYKNVREENNAVKFTTQDTVLRIKTRGETSNMAGMTQLILWWSSLGLTIFSFIVNLRHIVGYIRKKEKYLLKVDLFKGANLIFMTIGVVAVVVFVFTTIRLIFKIY